MYTVHYAPSAGGARGWSGGARSRAILARYTWHVAVDIGTKLYVWGGYDGSSTIRSTALEIFDVTSLNWKQEDLRGSDMPDGLRAMAVTSDGETAYCCCGRAGSYPNATYYNTVFEITPSQHLCKELQSTSLSHTCMLEKTSGSQVVRFQDKLVLYRSVAD